MPELRKCPFCGGEAKIETGLTFAGKTYFVTCANYRECDGYYVRTKAKYSKKEAIEAWNGRADHEQRETD